jgi:hypothetical protein
MTKSKFEAIAVFPNSGVTVDNESVDAIRDEFASIDFNQAEVMLLSSQFVMQAIHYSESDDLFYYVWREPAGIFGASVWGSQLAPERIEEIRVEPRDVIEHRYFRQGKNAPVGTRVVGLAKPKQDNEGKTVAELDDVVNMISSGTQAEAENTDTSVNMIVHPRAGNVATMECVVTTDSKTGESDSYFIMIAAEDTKNGKNMLPDA